MSEKIVDEKNVKLKRSPRKAAALKKILGHGNGLEVPVEVPQQSRADATVGQEISVYRSQKYHPAVMERAVTALNNGMEGRRVEEVYGVQAGYVRQVMNKMHVDPMRAKRALLNIVTENALAVQGVAAAKVEDLTAAQAVFAGKLLTDTMIDLDKHIQAAPKVVDFEQLRSVGDSIASLKSLIVDAEQMS